MTDSAVIGLECDLTIQAGRNLVAKDGSGFLGLGKAKSSDPYVAIQYRGTTLQKTSVQSKTLDPAWGQTFKLHLDGRNFRPAEDIVLAIYDHDKLLQLAKARPA